MIDLDVVNNYTLLFVSQGSKTTWHLTNNKVHLQKHIELNMHNRTTHIQYSTD